VEKTLREQRDDLVKAEREAEEKAAAENWAKNLEDPDYCDKLLGM